MGVEFHFWNCRNCGHAGRSPDPLNLACERCRTDPEYRRTHEVDTMLNRRAGWIGAAIAIAGLIAFAIAMLHG